MGAARDVVMVVATFVGDHGCRDVPDHSQVEESHRSVFSMSKVDRYSRDFEGNMCKDPNGPWVLVGDAAIRAQAVVGKLDAAQSELSALREELAVQVMTIQELAGANEDLQQRLKSAEQRNAELVELLRETVPALALAASSFKAQKPIYAKVKNALNPTESGASE